MNTHALLRATVLRILDRATDLEWSVQGLGMLRHYLTPEVRLHIWLHRFMVPNVTVIHSHPWDFRSYIVSGEVRQHRYTLGASGEPFTEQTIRCGAGACVMTQPKPVFLFAGSLEVYRPGHWYEQEADEIHFSSPVDGTVTLVERHFRADTEHAQVFYQTPAFVSAEPRPATPDEISIGVRAALDRWA